MSELTLVRSLTTCIMFCYQGPISRKSRELFWARNASCQTGIRLFGKLAFEHVFNRRKTKRIAKFDGLEPPRFKDIEEIVAPEMGPKSFGNFEKQTPVLLLVWLENGVNTATVTLITLVVLGFRRSLSYSFRGIFSVDLFHYS